MNAAIHATVESQNTHILKSATLLSNTSVQKEMHVHTCNDIQPDLVPVAVEDNGRA